MLTAHWRQQMPEKFEVGFYEFIRSELGGLETRLEKRMDERFSWMKEQHYISKILLEKRILLVESSLVTTGRL
jgi:hypothetical protein